ncbi:DUF2267 domain-containing protein [Gandjariella thermophila]|uniref:Putative pterin-4-alpha-carbinolamine dehydratase n=1 Tax=Gandjariella thermophila TaxID=1931992 RepID=A0A4D4J0W8_9PSEU|nr:DUF2267 domain-containing protein [Gandjariella thermophila]GDY28448.1 hypothetical protein GTS_00810 [Gandjariella thermophila]
MVEYQRLLATVSRMTGLGTGEARAAAEATITTLAHSLDDDTRKVLLDAVPTELRDDFPIEGVHRPGEQTDFVRRVALLERRPPEQARYRAQAVLTALVEQEPELLDRLHVPDDLRDLVRDAGAGGGITGPTGHTARLTDDEVRRELSRLPDWSGDSGGLSRTLALPPENLDRVLNRLDALRRARGRGPEVRRDGDTAVLTVRTRAVGGVTGLDVDLAHQVDDAIQEAGAGMA